PSVLARLPGRSNVTTPTPSAPTSRLRAPVGGGDGFMSGASVRVTADHRSDSRAARRYAGTTRGPAVPGRQAGPAWVSRARRPRLGDVNGVYRMDRGLQGAGRPDLPDGRFLARTGATPEIFPGSAEIFHFPPSAALAILVRS